MRHLRPLPPIEDPDHKWFLASGTALFAADQNGLDNIKSYTESYFNVSSYEDAPVDFVLCTGALRPEGPYTAIRRVERGIDLLDNWAPIGSDVPDPSLSKMKKDYRQLKQRKENGEFEGAEKEARWYLQKMEDDIYQVEGGLAEISESQKELWGQQYPSLCPTEKTPT